MTEAAAACAWAEKRTPEGKRFYYNRVTKERVWRRPSELPPLPASKPAAEAKPRAARTPAGKEGGAVGKLVDAPQPKRPPTSGGGGDADSGRGVAPDVGDSPDTGASRGDITGMGDARYHCCNGYW